MKAAIYTAIAGNYDRLKAQPGCDAELIAFLDSAGEAAAPWQTRKITAAHASPRLTAKWHKVMAHEALPDAEYSLWIDGSILIRPGFSLSALIDSALGAADIALFEHYKRNCIYDEAWECIRLGLDEPGTIYRQLCAYTRRGYPQNAGLHQATVILRRHTPAVAELNRRWWKDIEKYSSRDQISFDVAAAESGVKVAALPGFIYRNDYFLKFAHRDAGGPSPAPKWGEHLMHGLECESRGDLPNATLHYLRAVAEQSDAVDPWLRLAAILPAQGALADGLRAASKALELEPENQEALRLLAGILRASGDRERALQVVELYLGAFPEDSWGYLESAALLGELGRGEESARRRLEAGVRK